MSLNIQIYSFIYSFGFGILFYFLLEFYNKLVSNKNIFLKILYSLILIIVGSSSYFIISLYINNGYIHIYFLLSILVGYLFVYFLKLKWFTYKSKK